MSQNIPRKGKRKWERGGWIHGNSLESSIGCFRSLINSFLSQKIWTPSSPTRHTPYNTCIKLKLFFTFCSTVNPSSASKFKLTLFISPKVFVEALYHHITLSINGECFDVGNDKRLSGKLSLKRIYRTICIIFDDDGAAFLPAKAQDIFFFLICFEFNYRLWKLISNEDYFS